MLLGSIVVSLALVGSQAAARTSADLVPDPKPGANVDTRGTGLSLALHTPGAVYRSVGAMSDGAIEAVSLLALGLGLIGAGQALAQKRRHEHAATEDAAKPHGVAVVALESRRPGLRNVARRAAR